MRKVQFITQHDHLFDMESSTTLFVGGDLVFSNTTDMILDGFVKQPDRKAGPQGFSYAAMSSGAKMKTWIHKDVFNIGFAKKKHKILLINDHYLKWGLSKKRDCILIGGHCEKDKTLIEVFVFSKKSGLEKIDEMVLCSMDYIDRFSSELGIRIEELQKSYTGYSIYWADPLKDLPEVISANFGVMEIGFAPFRKLVYHPVSTSSDKRQKISGYQIPLAITILSFMGYAGTNFIKVKQFDSAANEYKTSTQSTQSEDYKFGSSVLELMQKRKDFMLTKSTQEEITYKLQGMIGHLALIPNVKVIEFEVRINTAVDDQSPDIRINFGVPKESGISALDQGNSILKNLSSKYGMILYLKKDSVIDSVEKKSGKDVEYRFFSVEGRHDTQQQNNEVALKVEQNGK